MDLVGGQFNYLTVKSYSHSRRDRYWNCLCDCGNQCLATTNQLTSGNKKSCGCLRKKTTAQLFKKRKPSDPATKNDSSINKLYYRYKKDAKKRNYQFNLSRDEFKQLIVENCFYCGTKPNSILNEKDLRGQIKYNGIDRINNDNDYNLDNVVPCCKRCNAAKSNMTLKEFLDIIDNIQKNMLKLRNIQRIVN